MALQLWYNWIFYIALVIKSYLVLSEESTTNELSTLILAGKIALKLSLKTQTSLFTTPAKQNLNAISTLTIKEETL